jgi:hypothetical protein
MVLRPDSGDPVEVVLMVRRGKNGAAGRIGRSILSYLIREGFLLTTRCRQGRGKATTCPAQPTTESFVFIHSNPIRPTNQRRCVPARRCLVPT